MHGRGVKMVEEGEDLPKTSNSPSLTMVLLQSLVCVIMATESTKTQTPNRYRVLRCEDSLPLTEVRNYLILFNKSTVVALAKSVVNCKSPESGKLCCEGGFNKQWYPLSFRRSLV
jgi:hypothetical protein